MSNNPEATSAPESKKPFNPILAFALGICLAAVVFFLLPKSQASTTATEPEATSTTTAEAASTTEAATEGYGEVDVAATFPSWNATSASLAELVDFVEAACDPESPSYVEPEERIATFDMDGTIIAEKAPIYVDYMLMIHRVLDDPESKSDAQTKEAFQKIRELANKGEKSSEYSPAKHYAVAHEFAGMTPEEFRAYVNDFLDNTNAEGFEGMTYGESFYKPMIEVIDYLRSRDFDVWIVSACEREVSRAAVERLGIAPDHVIATDVAYASTKQGDAIPDEYNMGQDEEVVLSEPLDEVECGQTGKSLAIAREIGRVPLLSFGNSSGDYGMLNYAEGHGGMGLLVVADDEVRDYGNAQKAQDIYATVADESWTAFSMADDWKTIYGEGVTKTCLPADEQTELAEAA